MTNNSTLHLLQTTLWHTVQKTVKFNGLIINFSTCIFILPPTNLACWDQTFGTGRGKLVAREGSEGRGIASMSEGIFSGGEMCKMYEGNGNLKFNLQEGENFSRGHPTAPPLLATGLGLGGCSLDNFRFESFLS